MFLLNVDLNLKAGLEEALEHTYKTVFVPAISKQEGFAGVSLLRSTTSTVAYRLVIQFENQPLQQKWVTTALHQEVWPQMESHFEDYSVQTYNLVQV